jgi:protein SCO1/2
VEQRGYDGMRQQRTSFVSLLIAASVLALAACGPAKVAQGPAQDAGQASQSGAPLVGGPFQLVDQNGRARDQSLLLGKWTAIFFGYTYCPDVCPTTLQALAQAQAQLGDRARALQVVFISVDPQRDTPQQLKTYLSAPVFPKGTTGLTGSQDQIAATAKAYRVFFQKQGQGDGYTVDHSSIIYLMDPKGKFDRVLSASLPPAEFASQIGQAMHDGPQPAT